MLEKSGTPWIAKIRYGDIIFRSRHAVNPNQIIPLLMPIIGLFPREEAQESRFRIHRSIIKSITEKAQHDKATITELVNYTLAARFAPELLAKMDAFKRKSRYSFPNRKTGNRYTKKV
jgi:hypothetical protein